MSAKNGLLIVSNPTHIGKLLSSAEKYIKNTVYIQLLCALGDNFGAFHPQVFTSWPKYSQTVHSIYFQAAKCCSNLDVRVLLSGLKYTNLRKIQTQRSIDLVIFDKKHHKDEIERFLLERVANKSENCSTVVLDGNAGGNFSVEGGNEVVCNHSVLGGTFDRLHLAHKLLLSEAALRSKQKITIGVTEENMLYAKTLWELIEPIDIRMNDVRDFLCDVCPELDISVVPISDPMGPTKSDPTMDLIVVSKETVKGGQKVNEVRTANGLSPLNVLEVELIDEPFPNQHEESKISSSTVRMRLLGTLLKPVTTNENIPKKPYIIGLTGGIASGKSNIAKRLQEHGAKIIDCDKVGHDVYKMGKPCYYKLIEGFGERIVGENGEVDRKVLGGIVFSDPVELEKLNGIVWPAISEEVSAIIRTSKEEVVVIEAAILLKAGWEKLCHEVWAAIIPENEAIERIKARNLLTEEQIRGRIRAQPNNKIYVAAANVVFCTLWSVDFSCQQVDKAWDGLKGRLN